MNHTSIPLAVHTTCPYCGVGCGVKATPNADGTVAIAGDGSHSANRGRLCVKGSPFDAVPPRGR